MPPIRATLHATSPQAQSQVIYSGAAARRAPLEVLEKIADDVDDNASLASCSLVCRIWSAAARRHYFRVVKISFEWPRENQRFTPISLLCDPTSTILPFVQEIHLTDRERYGGDRGFKLPSFNDILPAIRAADLTMLRSVAIKDFSWDELSEESRCSLMQLCRRITSLSLCAVEGISSAELIQLLLAAKSLRKVRVTNSGLTGGQPRHPSESYDLDRLDPARPISPITSIDLAGCVHAYLPALLATFSFPRLTEVILENIKWRDLDDVMSLLRVCSSTVEHLRLMFGGLHEGFRTEETRREEIEVSFISQGGLANLAALRSIHLTADLMHVPTILQPLMDVKQLEDLIIKASPYMLGYCDQGALARSISTLARAAVRLRVSFLCEDESDYGRGPLKDSVRLYWMRGKLLDKLSELQGSGRLRFLRIIRNRDTGRKIAIEEF